MAVVRNLMIRIGADYSAARRAMQGATRDLTGFNRDTRRAADEIRGRRGIGAITTEFRSLGTQVSSSLSRIQGSKGIGGLASELGSLKPMMGQTAAGLRTMSAAAAGTGVSFGVAGVAVAAFVAILGIAAAAIGKAAQPAVKFEADLGRLNMQLRGGARDYMTWARAQGLAKQSAAGLGATYSVLLSSFISDSQQLADETKRFVQTTRVVASATGRTIEDTTERMRSGLLGNTEAIEDLGIFVNVSMIESTNAFRKFAGDKSWAQLDFKMQQQIRLAAILEQAQARYGDSLQQNVMTKQTHLNEQLKDVRLNLSQAFLPIWDSILPALTKLAEAVAYVTEQLARLVYWLRGWDYEERTSGAEDYASGIGNVGDAYQETGKKAAKARAELAAFDRLNLLGDSASGSGSGGSVGSGGGGGGGSGGGNSGSDINLPKLPDLQLVFKPPSPPDAGMGAVATAVVASMNALTLEARAKMQQVWDDLRVGTQIGGLALQGAFGTVLAGLLASLVTSGLNLNTEWGNTLSGLVSGLETYRPSIELGMSLIGAAVSGLLIPLALVRVDWKATLSSLQQNLNSYRPYLEWGWALIGIAVRKLLTPLADVKVDWKATLSAMQQNLNSYRPYLEWGWSLIGAAVRSLKSPLSEVKTAWSSTLSSMATVVTDKVGVITGAIASAMGAWQNLKSLTMQNIPSPQSSPANSTSPSTNPSTSPVTNPFASVTLTSMADQLKRSFSQDTLLALWDVVKGEAAKPENKAAMSIYSMVVPAGKLAQAGQAVGKTTASALNQAKTWWDSLKGAAIPALARGGLAYGPTLAMVGDNPGAHADPEVIAPLSKLERITDRDNAEEVRLLQQILQAVRDGKTVQAVISEREVARAATNGINDQSRRMAGRNALMT